MVAAPISMHRAIMVAGGVFLAAIPQNKLMN
jgi:hypothetical protein